MRVTVSHNKPKQEMVQTVDRCFDDLFRGIGGLPIQIVNEKRTWTGFTLIFSFEAKVGVLSAPIRGTVNVMEKEVAIEVDLGLLDKLLPGKKVQEAVEERVRALLK